MSLRLCFAVFRILSITRSLVCAFSQSLAHTQYTAIATSGVEGLHFNAFHLHVTRVIPSFVVLFIFYYTNYIVYYNVYHNSFCVFIEKYVYAKLIFVVVSVSDIPIYDPIVMYGLRLFIFVLQEL